MVGTKGRLIGESENLKPHRSAAEWQDIFILLLLFPGSENSLTQIWKFGITFPLLYRYFGGFSGGSEDRESACNTGDPGSIPGSGRSPGEGNGNPSQCSCLENFMNRGAWLATVHRVQRVRYD